MRTSTLARAAAVMAIAVALMIATAACGSKVVVKEVVKVVPVDVIKEVPVEIVVEVPVIVEGTVSVPTIEVPSQATSPQASTAIATTVDQDTGPDPTAQTEHEDTGPIRLYIGGQARFLSTLEGLIDVDPDEPVAKTFRIDILIDDQNRYYFTYDQPLVVPAGERVKFIVYNTHFTPDECW